MYLDKRVINAPLHDPLHYSHATDTNALHWCSMNHIKTHTPRAILFCCNKYISGWNIWPIVDRLWICYCFVAINKFDDKRNICDKDTSYISAMNIDKAYLQQSTYTNGSTRGFYNIYCRISYYYCVQFVILLYQILHERQWFMSLCTVLFYNILILMRKSVTLIYLTRFLYNTSNFLHVKNTWHIFRRRFMNSTIVTDI